VRGACPQPRDSTRDALSSVLSASNSVALNSPSSAAQGLLTHSLSSVLVGGPCRQSTQLCQVATRLGRRLCRSITSAQSTRQGSYEFHFALIQGDGLRRRRHQMRRAAARYSCSGELADDRPMSGLRLIASGDSLLNYNVAVSIVVQLYSCCY